LNKKEQFCRIEAQKWAKFGGRNNNIFKRIVGGGDESRIARPPRRRPPRRQPPKVFRPARKSRAGAAKTVRLPEKSGIRQFCEVVNRTKSRRRGEHYCHDQV
jgi:hypothetical protein